MGANLWNRIVSIDAVNMASSIRCVKREREKKTMPMLISHRNAELAYTLYEFKHKCELLLALSSRCRFRNYNIRYAAMNGIVIFISISLNQLIRLKARNNNNAMQHISSDCFIDVICGQTFISVFRPFCFPA